MNKLRVTELPLPSERTGPPSFPCSCAHRQDGKHSHSHPCPGHAEVSQEYRHTRQEGVPDAETHHAPASVWWSSHTREHKHMFCVPRDAHVGTAPGQKPCAHLTICPTLRQESLFTLHSLLCALKHAEETQGGQQPKNRYETSEHPLTVAWNRLIFPISYSNYNPFPTAILSPHYSWKIVLQKPGPSSSLPKSFVMEMSFGI